MAGKGISINFLADVKDFLRGTSNVEDSLDDVADSLDEMAKDGDKATEKLQDSFKDLAKAAKASGTDAGDSLARNVRRGAQDAEAATSVYKKEAISNISEVTSSFTGSWESAIDAVQGTLGGVVQDLGYVGAGIGAAAAVGVGLIGAAFVKMEEDAQKAKTRVSELAQAYIEAGDAAGLEKFTESLKNIISGSEDAVKSFEEIRKKAKEQKLDVNALATAYAGGKDAIEGQIKAIQLLIEEQSKQYTEGEKGQTSRNAAGVEQIKQLEDTKKGLEKVREETTKAQEAEKAWLESGGAEMLAKRDAIDNINDAYDDVVNSVGDFLNKETGLLDVNAYLKAIDDRKKALQDYQVTLSTLDLTTDQKKALNAMGAESAMAWLKGYQSTSEENKKRLRDSLTEAASESSGSAKDALEKTFKDPIKAKIEADLDSLRAKAALDELTKQKKVKIEVQYVDKFGQEVG